VYLFISQPQEDKSLPGAHPTPGDDLGVWTVSADRRVCCGFKWGQALSLLTTTQVERFTWGTTPDPGSRVPKGGRLENMHHFTED
jgi:hypothetical protein